jgi:aspartyl-tRNA(Asn)/glutamyl-tRNA(Gln) amidotransferase subunit C
VGGRLSITRDELARIAALAALDIDDAALPDMVTQVGRILAYVSQLSAVESAAGMPAGSARHGVPQPLRRDEVRSGAPLDPRAFAPQLADGLFVVPRVSGLGSGDDA